MPINPTTLKALIDTQITNETIDFAITPAEVGGRMKDAIDYTTEQSLNIVNKNIKVTLSSSQILNLFTTPVELIPSVSGKLLILNSMYQKYNYGTTTYSNINTCKIGYGTTSLLLANLGLLVYDVTNANGIFAPSLNIASTSTYAGLPIVLGATISNPTTGDGTLDLYISYSEVTL